MKNQRVHGLVFFTDLTNFNRTTKSMELEQVAGILTTYTEIVHHAVTDGGGQVNDYLYDSVLGYFPEDKVDQGVRTLMEVKQQVENWAEIEGFKMKLRIAAHYGEFMIIYLPPFTSPDLLGDTVNIAVRLGSGGQSSHRGRLIISAAAFRKLDPETRKSFHKYTEPIVYLAEE